MYFVIGRRNGQLYGWLIDLSCLRFEVLIPSLNTSSMALRGRGLFVPVFAILTMILCQRCTSASYFLWTCLLFVLPRTPKFLLYRSLCGSVNFPNCIRPSTSLPLIQDVKGEDSKGSPLLLLVRFSLLPLLSAKEIFAPWLVC